MPHGLLDSDAFVWIEREEAIEKVIEDVVVALAKIGVGLHIGNLSKFKGFDILGQFEFVA